jgi:hypothetical protein
MALIQINKIEAVRRQIEAAIRMTFAGEDAVAIHAIAGDVHRIVQDFYRSRGDVEGYLRLGDWIAPVHAARFWRHFNAAAEFLRPGEWNPETIFELEEETNDFMIVFAARWYQMQGHAATRDMRIFATWYVACNPGILRPDAIPEAALTQQMQAMSQALTALARPDRLRAGRMALESAAPATASGQHG